MISNNKLLTLIMILLLATSCTNSQMSSDGDAIDTTTSDTSSIVDQESEIISHAIVTFNVDIPLEIESGSFIKLAQGSQTKNDTVAAFKNNINQTSVTRGQLTTVSLTMTQYSDNRSRLIRIWTPDGYDSTDLQRYPVIYMHDGQNLFDTYTAFAGEWRIDETIGAMMDMGYEGAIVVGIDNGPERLNELTVDWPLSTSANSYDIVPDGEKYAQFIVNTVKPYIDSNYKTYQSQENTFIGGSSLGGIMSFYMTLTYPQIFGHALLFSTSMWVYQTGTITSVISEANLGSLSLKPKIYVYGGGDESSNIPQHVNDIYQAFINNGYTDQDIKAHVEPLMGHNETAWALHFPIALNWLIDQTT